MHTVKPAKPYNLKAPKTIENLNIENLYAESSSLINNIPIAQCR